MHGNSQFIHLVRSLITGSLVIGLFAASDQAEHHGQSKDQCADFLGLHFNSSIFIFLYLLRLVAFGQQ